MKKIVALGFVSLVLTGCFEANDESGIMKTFCKDVPNERFQKHIGIKSQFRKISRDSAAIEFKNEAIRKGNTCIEELDKQEMLLLLLGVFSIMAISGH